MKGKQRKEYKGKMRERNTCTHTIKNKEREKRKEKRNKYYCGDDGDK